LYFRTLFIYIKKHLPWVEVTIAPKEEKFLPVLSAFPVRLKPKRLQPRKRKNQLPQKQKLNKKPSLPEGFLLVDFILNLDSYLKRG